MRLQIAIIIVVAGLLLMAGTGLSQETKQAPPAPIDVKKADLNQEVWNPDWDGVGDNRGNSPELVVPGGKP